MNLLKAVLGFIIFFGLFSAYFMFIDVSTENVSRNLFENIYVNADEESREGLVSIFDENCQNINNVGENVDVCGNETLILELEESCESYQDSRDLGFDKIQEFEELCGGVIDGTLEESCRVSNELGELNLTTMSEICDDYDTGNLTEQDFFVDTLVSVIPDDIDLEISEYGLWKINEILNLVFVFLLAPSLIILYFILGRDQKSFFRELGSIFLVFGFLILIPYLILKLFLLFGINTSEILTNLIRWGNLDASAQRSIILKLSPFVMDGLFGNLYSLIMGLVGVGLGVLFRGFGKEEELL